MSYFNRRRLLVTLCALPLAACNFQPVHGPGGAGDVIRDQIRVTDPETRFDFELVSRMEDRIGTGSAFDLSYTIVRDVRNLAIDEDEITNRVNLVGTLSFTVRPAGSDEVVQSGEVSTFTSYATTISPVADIATRRDAEDRLAVALADQVVLRLIAGAASWPRS